MAILPTHLLQTANGFLHPTVPHFSLKCSSAWAVVFHPHPHTTYTNSLVKPNTREMRLLPIPLNAAPQLTDNLHSRLCCARYTYMSSTCVYARNDGAIYHSRLVRANSFSLLCQPGTPSHPHDSAATRTHTYTHALQTTTTYAFLAHYARTAKPHQRSAASIESEISIAMQSLVCTYILHEPTCVSPR